jgi:poly(glycerol-phosphate) alpha-glucosyltransferase
MAVLTGSLSRLAGGTFSSIKRPMQEITRQFAVDMRLFGVWDPYSGVDLATWEPLKPEVFPSFGPRVFGWSPGMARAVRSFHPDLIQVHGIWMHCSVVSDALRRGKGIPHIVHLHGMLDPWAVRASSWKKRVATALYEGRHLRGASCIRALCDAEAEAVRQFGLSVPVCIIPNGIDLPGEREKGPPPWGAVVRPGRKVLLFLSRIHAKKNVPNLLRAWSTVTKVGDGPARDWDLVIAGWDTTGHEPELRRLARALEVEASVHFVGPLFNEDKERAYQNAAAFALPSLSEGLPMTVLEAWAYSLPVLMTPQCNLPEGFAARAAISAEVDVDSLTAGLSTLLEMTEVEREAMGVRGRHLVTERFQWTAIARQMHEVNLWVTGRGARPGCVV